MRFIKILVISLTLVASLLLMINFELSGIIYHNDFLAKKYKIEGLDISHHQIKINFEQINKKYKFIIMKATEGQDFLDTDFLYNFNKAQLSGFYIGAYHFFTMTSSGENQANYYISKVPVINDGFPPIIDVELASFFKKEEVIEQLSKMVEILEKHYNKRVIIYTNYKTYDKYLKNQLKENYLWIRDIKKHPRIEEDDRWIIWQYSNRGRINGISGFTDKNVLRYEDINWYIKGLEIKRKSE